MRFRRCDIKLSLSSLYYYNRGRRSKAFDLLTDTMLFQVLPVKVVKNITLNKTTA